MRAGLLSPDALFEHQAPRSLPIAKKRVDQLKKEAAKLKDEAQRHGGGTQAMELEAKLKGTPASEPRLNGSPPLNRSAHTRRAAAAGPAKVTSVARTLARSTGPHLEHHLSMREISVRECAVPLLPVTGESSENYICF
jgi:hypothetical protein